MILQFTVAGLVWLALTAYGVLGGADFGGGIWDLFSYGKLAERQRSAIINALGPVWEANNVWLIFAIVLTFTGFPTVFSALSQALFIPLTIALLGITLRGAAFVFRNYTPRSNFQYELWGRTFSAASIITPFMFGVSAGAIVGGNIRFSNGITTANYFTTWITPFAIVCGFFALGMCATLAATYLAVEAENAQDTELSGLFRFRATVAGAITALFGLFAFLLASGDAPLLWKGMIGPALPIMLLAMIIGIVTAFLLFTQRLSIARITIVTEIALIMLTWAVGLSPMLVPPDLTISKAAAPDVTLQFLIWGTIGGMVFLLPSLWLLFKVFKSSKNQVELH